MKLYGKRKLLSMGAAGAARERGIATNMESMLLNMGRKYRRSHPGKR